MLTRHARGFTIVELMVSLAVLSILLSMAAPSLQSWLEAARVRAAAESWQSGLSLARAEAVRLNAQVRFSTQAGGWTITRVDTGESLHEASGREGAAALVLTWSPAGTSSVSFDAFGRVSDPKFSVAGSFVTLDLASASLPDWKPLRLQIQSSGLARLCDPTASAPDPRTCL